VIPHLLPGRVLEMAHGTGTLALEIADRGYAVTAVDLSPAMGKIAAAKKLKHSAERNKRAAGAESPAANPSLVRADLRQLPFPAGLFSSAVSTFPADFIFQRRTLQEAFRLLRPGGRWIILPAAYPEWLASRLLPGAIPDSSLDLFAGLARHLEAAGFAVRTEIIRRPRSRVMLVLAEKK
jgi:SAM-dependent methyltransferase